MTWDKCKVWTYAELEEWDKKLQEEKAKYRVETARQLDEWVKGNSIHNPLSSICAVVDENDVVVGYIKTEGGECCPEFSCCGGKLWPEKKRFLFAELHRKGDQEATTMMLMGSIGELTAETIDGVYIAGQIDDSKTLH